MTRSRAGSSRLRWLTSTPAFMVLTILLVAWAALITSQIYDFNATVLAAITTDPAHYLEVLIKPPKGVSTLLFVLWVLISALGPGDLILRPLRVDWRDEAERAIFGLSAGLIAFTFITLLLGALGALRTGEWVLLCASTGVTTYALAGTLRRARNRQRLAESGTGAGGEARWPSAHRVVLVILVAVLAAYAYIALLGTLMPEVQFDARVYHLGPPVHYAQAGRMYDLVKQTHLARAGWPSYQETLYTMLVVLGGPAAAKLLHWADGVLIALFLVYLGWVYLRSLGAGLIAAIFFISTPVVTWSMSTANNDLAQALYGL